jgi:transposase InsO family protein
VNLTKTHREDYGLNQVLSALGLSKRTWYYALTRQTHEERYGHLKEPLFEIARLHPEYGVPRTVTELKARGYQINHKVLERLNALWDLSLIRRVKRPRESSVQRLLKDAGPRINLVASLKEIKEFEVLYTDITEIVYQKGHSKAKLMPIFDHGSRLVVGHAVAARGDTELALAAWKNAKTTLRRFGARPENTIIHHDQDGVYRGHQWLYQVAVRDKVTVSFTERGAKDNVHIEAFNGRFKEENRLLFWEQKDLESLMKVIHDRIGYYNRVRRHSALGNKSPIQYLKEKGHIPGKTLAELSP